MAENTSIPTLTLDPNGAQVAAQAVSLEEEIKQAAETTEPAVEQIELEKLSQEEQAAVNGIRSSVGITHPLRMELNAPDRERFMFHCFDHAVLRVQNRPDMQ